MYVPKQIQTKPISESETTSAYLIATEVDKVVLEHTRRGVARGRRNASGALLEDRLDDRERLVVGHVERLNARRAGADLGVPSQQKREREREREREGE